ncbi:alpha/beta hydrolase [Sphingomonas sp. AP4-R1]|uniref:alpha/beta fold hydrolase n=1 Tax=Sphingomonas sp. AP4-R1 TaxID=2735134 RepID=UPI00149375F7|nr:alpha/beta hydrolase [Sphingomonas sp. AP4-R1]QJU60572.1 alpha/beta hydrolase [Sphingomonas sp. AP4-R1]
MSFEDRTWLSPDGLALHYRDYPGSAAATPVLCIPGLTRNARDFEGVAERLSGARRVIVVELRGRGQSHYAPDPMTYVPPVYVGDILALIQQAGLGPVALFGTSLGGIVAMLLSAMQPDALAGVLLNDVGPVIDPAGLARIAAYTGRDVGWPDWDTAAAAQAATHAHAFPDYGPAEWLAMAHRVARDRDGLIVTDYDPAIAVPFSAPPPDPAPDPWPFLNGLVGKPALLVRGALSDILSAETAARMIDRLPQMELLTLPRIGHAPMLDEPECVAAIDRLLARIDAARE